MKRIATWVLSVLLTQPLWAQAVAPPQASDSQDALAQIEATRARENAAFDAQEAECYKHFIVNSCLKDVQSRRTAKLRDLKRQEISLHDAERKQQGAEALERIEQKTQEKADKDAQAELDSAGNTTQDRQQAQKDKQAEHAAKATNPGVAASGPRETTAPTAAQQAQNREAYANKLAEAAKKREAAAKRISEKTGKPLPPRPAASQAVSPVAPASQPQ
ncbi:hypothetical protein [Rhodoferax sp. GW822-FHT02A01]|uniref:hypothetical protein n=1 Tax=Rhodoferax sp. GW822-FHT02A01 TaxID=3141537 RepID=UPI00315C6D46